jgi:hypothetical protein
MVQNMVMPQTAALFGQMNTFGAERYQQFLTAYPLSAQQRDARDQYLQACMAEVRAGLGGAGAGAQGAMLNARAAEMCLQRYNDQSRQIQAQKGEAFADFSRQAQDVNAMLAPLMCPTSGTAASTVCWPNLLLTQVRLCAEGQLDANGRLQACDANNFGPKPAPVPFQTLMDIMVQTVGTQYLTSTTNPFLRQLAIVDGASLRNAANRARGEIKNQPITNPVNTIADFQTDYLQCVSSNPFAGLRALGQVVYDDVFGGSTDGNTQLPNGSTLAQERQRSLLLNDTGLGPFQTATQQVLSGYAGLASEQRVSLEGNLASAMHAAVGCAANRDIPFLDPMTVITMRNTCSPDDLQGYFKLAAMDVANVAARNMYLYTKQQLEGAIGRLEANDPTVLRTTRADGTVTTLDSPAIRQRLALAARTIMLPQLNSDLKRIENLQTLAQKSVIRTTTQGIYRSGSGCLNPRSQEDRR